MSRTGRNFLTPGVMNGADHSPDREESSIAVAVTGMRSAWRLRIFAEGQEGPQKTGMMYVGSVRTLPWNGGDRVVAFACCPGAVRWFVDGQPEDHTVREEPCVRFMGAPCCAPFGVTPNSGVSLPSSHHLRMLTGVSGGPINPPGAVFGWTASAGAAGATVAVTMPGDLAPTVVIIPPGGSFHDYLNGESGDSVTFTFTGTLSYVIDYELPGDGLDAF